LLLGDVAYRVNLASAVLGALTVALLFGVGYRGTLYQVVP
jgi:hypothetical protein